MLYSVVRPEDGAFTFMAPWDEEMVAAGDVIVRNPMDAKDIYRVAGASFACARTRSFGRHGHRVSGRWTPTSCPRFFGATYSF